MPLAGGINLAMDFVSMTTRSLPLILLPCILLWWMLKNWKNGRSSARPPGPPALPIIGHLHLLAGKPPHHSLSEIARKYGPLVELRLGSVPVLVASSADMAEAFLKTHDSVFASRPSLLMGKLYLYDSNDMVLAPYGEHWRNMKKLCTQELFTERRVASFRDERMEELIRMMGGLVDASKKKELVVFQEFLTEFTFNVITRMLMTKVYFGSTSQRDAEEAREFKRLQNEGVVLAGKFHIGDYIPYLKWLDFSVGSIKKLHRSQDAFLQKIVDEHKAKKQGATTSTRKDFVDILFSASIQDTKIKALFKNLLGAGTDTTISTIQWAMAELINHPHILKKAQDELQSKTRQGHLVEEPDLLELTYLQAIVKETLRLHPAVPLMVPHESVDSCMVGGCGIPKGTRLFINVYAIGRDPSVWKSPQEFTPERFLDNIVNIAVDVHGREFEMLPFGSGRRRCPGISLALVTVQLVLANLLHGFDWTLPFGRSSHPLKESLGAAVTLAEPLKAMPVLKISIACLT